MSEGAATYAEAAAYVWDGAAKDGVDMGRGDRTLDLDEAVLADEAVGTGA